MLLGESPRLGERTVRPEARRTKRTFGQKLVKRLILAARIALFFVLYLGWPLFRRWIVPDLIFLVYGTVRDQRAYWPSWATRFFRAAFPIGLLRYQNYWGFVATTPYTAEELAEHPERVSALFNDCLREFPNARTISLAGRLPSLARRSGAEIVAPYVEGTKGTRYAMLSAARALAEKSGRPPGELCIAVPGGAGFIGSLVASDLASEFRQVIALDPRYDPSSNEPDSGKPLPAAVSATHDPVVLRTADLSVILTAQGDDIENSVPHFRRGALVADDTHPPIHPPLRRRLNEQGVDLWKATMADGHLVMLPRLPNFRRDSIPGCLLEALVVLLEGRRVLEDQQRFNEAADRHGFRAKLIRHPED